MRILILGAHGMIGSTFYRVLSQFHETWGTVRRIAHIDEFNHVSLRNRLLCLPTVLDMRALNAVIQTVKPDVIINAVGIVKQLSCANDFYTVMPLNAVFPHQLAVLCAEHGTRLIHMSTDCVFSGKRGLYQEIDYPDADDLYGQSKAMGEVHQQARVLTIRTSTIGHEMGTHHGLLEWFLSQTDTVHGFENAVFSGIPTVLLAHIISEYVLPNPKLYGVYHVASNPINKYELLHLIKEVYQHPVNIEKNTAYCIDRSLNGLRFRQDTGYTPLSWKEQIKFMYQDLHRESSYV